MEQSKRRLSPGDRICLAAALLLLGFFGVYFGLDAWARHRINAQLARIREAGDPVTMRDLQRGKTAGAGITYLQALGEVDRIAAMERAKWTTLRKQKDAKREKALAEFIDAHVALQSTTPAVEAEIGRLASTHPRDMEPPESYLLTAWIKARHDADALEERDVAQAAAALAAYAQPLEELRQAAGMEHCEFHHITGDYSKDRWLLSAIADSGDLLTSSTLVHLRAERFDAAAREIVTLLRFRRVTQTPRDFWMHWHDRKILSRAARLTAELLPHLPPDSPWLARIDAELEAACRPEHVTRMLIIERAKAYDYLDHAREHEREAVEGWEYLPQPLIIWQIGDYLVEAQRMVAASRDPLPQMFTSFESGRWNSLRFFDHCKGTPEREAEALAVRSAARAAIAVTRFGHEHGSLPRRLNELIPDHLDAVPVDPFTGEPMLLRVADDGYAIYSVGANLRDDGGNLHAARTSRSLPPRDEGLFVRLK